MGEEIPLGEDIALFHAPNLPLANYIRDLKACQSSSRRMGSGSNLLKGVNIPAKFNLVNEQTDDGVMPDVQL
jgi:hypothetical protein